MVDHTETDIKALAEAVQTLFQNADAEVPCAVFDILTRDDDKPEMMRDGYNKD